MKDSIALLILRVSTGLLMITQHGWPKLIGFTTLLERFPDPIGIGVPLSLALTVFAELFCSVLIIFGLMTRLATLPPIITMLVALFVIHASDPIEKKELALLYLIPFTVLALIGPGKISLDAFVLRKK